MAIVLLELDCSKVDAGNYTTSPVSCGDLPNGARGSILLQGVMTGGVGGDSIVAHVQSTADNGNSWYDVACFSFTTGSKTGQFNIRTSTPVITIATPTLGTLAADTSVDGLVGEALQVFYTVTGDYTAGTLLITAVLR